MFCGMIEGGRKCSAPYARMELAVWLQHDPLAPRVRRPHQLEEAFEALIGDVVEQLELPSELESPGRRT